MKNEIIKNITDYDVLWAPRTNEIFLIKQKEYSNGIIEMYNHKYEVVKAITENLIYLKSSRSEVDSIIGTPDNYYKGIWINKKNLNMYSTCGILVEATNDQEGVLKVLYRNNDNYYAREISEFIDKFIPKLDSMSRLKPEEIEKVYKSNNVEVK